MKARNFELPIVCTRSPTHHFPFEVLGEQFVAQWNVACQQALSGPTAKDYAARLLKRFECLLQVTGLAPPKVITAENFLEVDRLFKLLLAATFSDHFWPTSESSRQTSVTALQKCRAQIARNLGVPLTWEVPHSPLDRAALQTLIALFNEIDLIPSKVLLWQSWPCPNKQGTIIHMALAPMQKKLGDEFTQQLYEICLTHLRGRVSLEIAAVKALSKYLQFTDRDISPVLLKQPDFTTEFFFDLYEHYLHSNFKDGEGWSVFRIVSHWRSHITKFFQEDIFPSGLIAAPSGPFPTPKAIPPLSEFTNVCTGTEGDIHEKLLTPVPLHLTDDETMELIFHRIKSDLEATKHWAWSEVERVAQVLERRFTLAKIGGVREIAAPGRSCINNSTEWNHPDHLANAAATYEYHGYPCSRELKQIGLLFPAPRERWVNELAIPATGMLIPHCTVLVSEHPQITCSFLDQLELFDKNGKLRAVIPTDTGKIIAGVKMRRGPSLAAQEINLSARAAFALDQIIRITAAARGYLRSRGDDAWRYLLLTTSKGFGIPARASNLGQMCNTPRVKNILVEGAQRVLHMTLAEAQDFSRQFTVASVRASAAVVVYLETRSVHKMAEALGHARVDLSLLQRYLPRPIYEFFQERWVRIFQTGIIVQAMQGSKHLLRASGLRSIAELDAFMNVHSLKLPPTSQPIRGSSNTDPWAVGDLAHQREVIFGLNTEILTVLLSLKLAKESSIKPLLPKAIYWAEVTEALLPYVRSAGHGRDDIRLFLEEAESRACASLVDGIAYAS